MLKRNKNQGPTYEVYQRDASSEAFFSRSLSFFILMIVGMIIFFAASYYHSQIQDSYQQLMLTPAPTAQAREAVQQKIQNREAINILLLLPQNRIQNDQEETQAALMTVLTLNPVAKKSKITHYNYGLAVNYPSSGQEGVLGRTYTYKGLDEVRQSIQTISGQAIDYSVVLSIEAIRALVKDQGGLVVTFDQGVGQLAPHKKYWLTDLQIGQLLDIDYQLTPDQQAAKQGAIIQALIQSYDWKDLLFSFNHLLQLVEGQLQTDLPYRDLVNLAFKRYYQAFQQVETAWVVEELKDSVDTYSMTQQDLQVFRQDLDQFMKLQAEDKESE